MGVRATGMLDSPQARVHGGNALHTALMTDDARERGRQRVPIGTLMRASSDQAAGDASQHMASSEPQKIPHRVGSGYFLPHNLPLAEAISSPPNPCGNCLAGWGDQSTSMESSATITAADLNSVQMMAAACQSSSASMPSSSIEQPSTCAAAAAATASAAAAAATSASTVSRAADAAPLKPRRAPPVLLRNSMSLTEVLSPTWASCAAGNTTPPTSTHFIDPAAMHDEDRSNFIDGGQRISQIWE